MFRHSQKLSHETGVRNHAEVDHVVHGPGAGGSQCPCHGRGGVDASMDDSAHAVDETKMDIAMMEGGPEVMDEGMPSAPSVALSGEAKMGLKREDDNASMDPESDDIKTVVEYEVKFSSSGVTDGGLVFGAAISIDEDGKGAADKNGVNAASVHIGSAEGTWKLQFGSNDPGIDLVGNVGLADADDISGMTKTVVPIEYKLADGTLMRMRSFTTLPHTLYSDLDRVGRLETLALPGTVEEFLYFNLDDAGKLNSAGFYDAKSRPLSGIKQKAGGITYTLVVTANDAALNWALNGTNMPAPPPGRTDMALTGTIDSFSYALTAGAAGEDTWSAGIKYDPGAFYISAGMDYNDVKAIGAGGTFAGNTVKATYVRQDKAETYYSFISTRNVPDSGFSMTTTDVTVNDMEAFGLSVERSIGSGMNVTLTWSQLEDKSLSTKKDIANATTEFVGTKRWELDFTYDLGGGASFYAGVEQANKSEFTRTYNVTLPTITEATVPTYNPIIKKSKVTTLETGITMKF